MSIIDESLLEKRTKLMESLTGSEATTSDDFNSKLLSLSRQDLDEDERLLETAIRYSLAYLEEFEYTNKLMGVRLLSHLIDNTSPSGIKLNMRADLIRDTLGRYVNDKESLEFLDQSNELMIKLLGLIGRSWFNQWDKIEIVFCFKGITETKYNTNEHYFKQTSAYIDSALNNCYMSTNVQVKAIYLKHLKTSLTRLGPCACRHLEKQLTVLFDSIELGKVNSDFQPVSSNTHLVLFSLDLMQCIIQACFYRIHSHSRRIIQFLLKLVYSYCQNRTVESIDAMIKSDDCDDQELMQNKENNDGGEQFRQLVCLKSLRLVKMLFRNDRIRCSLYDDFKQVKSDAHLNRSFLKLIENI